MKVILSAICWTYSISFCFKKASGSFFSVLAVYHSNETAAIQRRMVDEMWWVFLWNWRKHNTTRGWLGINSSIVEVFSNIFFRELLTHRLMARQIGSVAQFSRTHQSLYAHNLSWNVTTNFTFAWNCSWPLKRFHHRVIRHNFVSNDANEADGYYWTGEKIYCKYQTKFIYWLT